MPNHVPQQERSSSILFTLAQNTRYFPVRSVMCRKNTSSRPSAFSSARRSAHRYFSAFARAAAFFTLRVRLS